MKLSDYIKMEYSGNVSAAARSMGKKKQTVQQWCDGTIPRKADGKFIYVWSEHHVTPNDFYDLPLEVQKTESGEIGRRASPLRVHAISEAKEGSFVQGMAAAGNGSAMPSQNDLFCGSNIFAEARS